uniref:Gamma-glutamyltranspeptidase 1 n=1 Tax=Plectus sambesii TaxID=2011161 RepID=A0A914WJ81_9BILA
MSSFINNATGQLYKEGEIMVQPKLASVLDKLASASNPVELFYDGAIAHEIAKEMKEHGGLITANDLKQYKSLIHEDTILNEHLPNGLAMCGPPPPSSFAVTQSIISIIGAFYGNDPDPRSLLNDPLTYHRFIEAMKFGYAQRAHLGDANFVKDSLALARNMTTPEYTNWIKSKITNRAEKPEYYAATVESVPDDHGTSQSSAIDAQGIAVSCTATINRWFGAGRESSHGFMWNNEMDDFSQPNQVNSFGYAPSKSNFIKPGKRPMSSMSPTVVFERESGKVRMVLGASGGSQIISGVAEVAVLSLFFNQTIKEAVDWPRLHNQFSPHATSYESSFLKSILQDLRSRGQNVTEFAVSGSHIQAIFVAKDGQIYANSDFRRRISHCTIQSNIMSTAVALEPTHFAYPEVSRVKRPTSNHEWIQSARLAWSITMMCTGLFTTLLIVVILMGISMEAQAEEPVESQWAKPSPSLLGRFSKAAIATDHGLCSEIGRNILQKGGNAVESSIAALFCVGVTNPQSSGLGGGSFMTIYNSTTKRCIVIDSRETAPGLASERMYIGDPLASRAGYRAIAVPGELHGYWTAFTRFGSGKLQWKELVQPTIDLCLNGFPVSSFLAHVIKVKEVLINEVPSMGIFKNPSTGKILEAGDIMKLPELAATLRKIADSSDPVELFYNGEMADAIVNDMKQNGGLITKEDLANYKSVVREEPLINEHLPNNLEICGPPPPSSFAVAQSIIAVIGEFYGRAAGTNLLVKDPLVYHRIIEAMKFAYAQRTLLGDSDFVKSAITLAKNMTTYEYTEWIKSKITSKAEAQSYYGGMNTSQPEDHGTSQVSALDASGNAVSTTSTINRWFGAQRRSTELGILWNDEMDDFSTPGFSNGFGFEPSETNFIRPGKRPMSSMSPMIAYDKTTGKVKMVLGASGGSQIISAIAETAIRALFFNQTIKEAVDWPRLHNQFLPHFTMVENGFPQKIIDNLEARGQELTIAQFGSVVQALTVGADSFIYGNSDYRRATVSYPAGF